MTQNPYQAPAAPVSDPLRPDTPKPAAVRIALRGLWAVFVLSLLSLHPWIRGEWWVFDEAEFPQAAALYAAIMIAVVLFSCVGSAFLLWLLGRRIGWARWATLAWVLVGLWGLVTDLPTVWAETPLAVIVDGTSVALDLACCALLFFGAGAQWFRQPDA
jgi:hypothetical protein